MDKIREITKEIYERALQNRRYITDEDRKEVWDISDLCGYGIYGDQVYEEDGKYFVRYWRGNTCD